MFSSTVLENRIDIVFFRKFQQGWNLERRCFSQYFVGAELTGRGLVAALVLFMTACGTPEQFFFLLIRRAREELNCGFDICIPHLSIRI